MFKYLKDGTSIVPEDDPVVYVSKEDDPENWHAQVFLQMAPKQYFSCNELL